MAGGIKLAIVGATGAVGQEMLKLLAERNFPLQDLFVVADPREAGKTVSFNDKDLIVQAASPEIFAQADAALFAVDSSISKILAPMAIENKCLVIDNSNAFRMDEKVPLVVPEVNAEDIKLHQGLIANPNCSTIIMVVAINPIHKAVGIERVVVSTYQAVSGAGAAGIDELSAGVAAYQDQVKLEPKVFQHPIAFNVIPHIDVFEANDYTREEMKMVFETRKIMHAEDIRIAATAVRVPVYRSHSEAISIETKTHITPEQVRDILKQAPGVIVQDQPGENHYPMPLYAANKDEVYVGRIREDISSNKGIMLWVAADQIRKGAATNAIQIAEYVVEHNLY
ncbi:MAG TPA: aspartate-semialdehyde dehydrogenase [Syntrophomonadaceae bacterium]|nr:aspartate-semialdehyde dehydrogenase [Syntrophomonadaceae bacterium]HRX21215.1 aspartate-semialdehyde dehydrogenase [Syntrophomonadaceae bacterium]